MSDALLTRIAVALEALVTKAGTEVKVVAAEVVAEAAKVAKPRGRPAKGEENGVAVQTASATAATTSTPATTPAATTAATVEADPFAIETPAAPAVKLELSDVRAALIAYQKATSPETARQKLKQFGGVDSLASLSPDKFNAVVDSLK